jgi:hypothetical protein
MKSLDIYLEYINEGKKQERAGFFKRPIAPIIGGGIGTAKTIGVLKMPEISGSKGLKRLVAGLVAINIINLSTVIYQSYLSKASKACKGDKFKMACMMEYKYIATQKQIAELIKNKNKCKSSDNPKKCAQIIDDKIQLLKWKANNFKQSAKYYRSSGII